jgi:hypothetical protein
MQAGGGLRHCQDYCHLAASVYEERTWMAAAHIVYIIVIPKMPSATDCGQHWRHSSTSLTHQPAAAAPLPRLAAIPMI